MEPKKKKASKSTGSPALAGKHNSIGGDLPGKLLGNYTTKIPILFKLHHEKGVQKSCLTPRNRCPQDLVTVLVNPKQRIRDLKLILRYELRIPFYENFELARMHKTDGLIVWDDNLEVDVSSYKALEQGEIWVVMEGLSLGHIFYRKLLSERCDNNFPLGRPVEDFPPLPLDEPLEEFHPVAQPDELLIRFKLAHTLNRLEENPRYSVTFLVDPKITIGVLKIKLRCLLWLPYDEMFDLAHLHGPLLLHDIHTTLDRYSVKNQDTLLVLMNAFPLYRPLLFECNSVDFPVGEPRKMQIFVKSAHYIQEFWRFPERSEDNRHIVRLTVEPTLTIGDLKSMLQSYYWIPRKNLVLLSEPTAEVIGGSPERSQLADFYEDNEFGNSVVEYSPMHIFDDDDSTLDLCGIKEGQTLLSCMDDGSFETDVFDYRTRKSFTVSVTSCFQTVQDLKMEIERTQFYYHGHQVLTTPEDTEIIGDTTPLVVLGIVKPFMDLMDYSELLKLRMLQPRKKNSKARKKIVC